VEENMRLCGAGDHHHDWPAIAIAVPEEVQDYVDHYVDATFDGGKLLIAMHVPVTRPEKRWPLGHFAELSDMLLADGRFEVALTYGPGQSTCAREVAERSRRYPHIAPDMPDLKHYAWFVGRADLYFGGDTGPMHIAAAMGTPVAAVFGGTDPKQHRPYRVPQEILYRPEAGKSAAARLEAITPEEAYDACVRLATQGGEVQPGSSQDL
jgi:ADP-heptose:LPS heptosyltransferase